MDTWHSLKTNTPHHASNTMDTDLLAKAKAAAAASGDESGGMDADQLQKTLDTLLTNAGGDAEGGVARSGGHLSPDQTQAMMDAGDQVN